MVENIAKSYSEVHVILSKLDRRYYNKISQCGKLSLISKKVVYFKKCCLI